MIARAFAVFVASSMLAAPRQNREAPAGCIDVRSEARYRNYGYDHIVVLESRCSQKARCEVSTDVNPALETLSMPPSERAEVLTFRGSPARQFFARVRCTF